MSHFDLSKHEMTEKIILLSTKYFRFLNNPCNHLILLICDSDMGDNFH